MVRMIRQWLRAALRPGAVNNEMNDEMAEHLARATERHVARGLSRREAELAARREFGNLGVLQEQGRDARGASWLESLRSDIRYGARTLRASPGFATVAILSLAIGIGANTAIFSLINAVVLRPLPVHKPGELVILKIGGSSLSFSYPLFASVRDKAAGIGTIAASGSASFNLADGGEERLVDGDFVSGDYFSALGIRPAQGRLISRADDQRGCPLTAVVSHSFWRSQLGGRADAVGSELRIAGRPFRILGVAPEGFTGLQVGVPTSIWIPLCIDQSLDARSYWWITVFARLGPGVTPQAASRQLATVSRAIYEDAAPARYTGKRREEFIAQSLDVFPAANGVSEARREYSSPLFALMAMVSVILLISCANVANLMLARGTTRGREMAIRVAIGASRTRLLRQLLTESVLLAFVGAAVGLMLAQWTSRSLISLLGTESIVGLDPSIDWRVAAFTASAGLLTVLLCGLLPAWRATRVDPQSMMKTGTAPGGRTGSRLAKSLVVAQCALALTVVTAATLLGDTLRRLTTTAIGFEPKGVVVASVNLRRDKNGLGENLEVQQAILEGIRAIPGVRDAAITNLTPMGRGSWNNKIAVEGYQAAKEMDGVPWFNAIGEGFFRTLGTPIVAGREFNAQDTKTSMPVAIVNRAAARRYFGGRTPIGEVLRIDEAGKLGDPITIVGVAEDSKYQSIREDRDPIVYLPAAQDRDNWASPTYVVASNLAPAAVIEAIKGVAARVDTRMSLRFTTLSEQVARSVQRERLMAVLSISFAALAFLLAMIGLYGIMAYTIARRRVEIGVRIALGALRSRVIGMVLGEVGRMMAIGIVLGAVGAFFVTPLLGSFLFGVEPNDPLALLAAIVLLGGGALLAGLLPARRAASMHPTEALRQD